MEETLKKFESIPNERIVKVIRLGKVDFMLKEHKTIKEISKELNISLDETRIYYDICISKQNNIRV